MTTHARFLIAGLMIVFTLWAYGQASQPAGSGQFQTQGDLKQTRKTVLENQTALANLETQLKSKSAEAAPLQKVFHYTSPDAAFAEFVEMDKLIRLIDIDIAGVKARLDAIKELADKYTSAMMGGPGGPPTGPAAMPGPGRYGFGDRGPYSLDRRRTDQDIEMAGLLARRKAAEMNRDKVKQYYDFLTAIAELKQSIAEHNAQLASAHSPQTQPAKGQ